MQRIPLLPLQAVYTICAFFYNLEWIDPVTPTNPITPTLTVRTGGQDVAVVRKPMARPGEFSFTLLPRNCTAGCPWFLAQVCVSDKGDMVVVSGDQRCP